MNKGYKPYNPNQIFLFPPSPQDWLPKEHLVYFISDLVDELDLSTIKKEYEKGTRGQPPYHPALMTKILFYAYCRGVFSSRKIATHLFEDVSFIVLAGGEKPDFRTVNEFRRRHIKSLPGIFVQIIQLCEKAGLVSLKHVALDGSKINANASKHKAMSYDRMKTEEKKLEKEIKKLLEKANHIDLKEDKQFGQDHRGDEIPEELTYRETRLAKIREAKAALEAEAKLAKEEDEKKRNDKDDPPTTPPRGKVKYDKKTGEPEAKAQRNFTDPDSRIVIDLTGRWGISALKNSSMSLKIILPGNNINQSCSWMH